ncbi:hypothetical protein EWN99_21625 [Salmonella enterica]|nr:hypothetical protein [Salmonella enterica]EBS3177226.1 hypothetical protein [Salmonella enterica subsp. enterica serovar Newport]EBS3869385.1 hypothetical protein [Salmonella enterica subsp. enterica serovar Kimberley]EDL3630102.1 hypothetical protein [Salmonella enterica subsp. enterica serovar Newport]EEE9161443.1 hypothetical protein [Salmonella enterica subsp. enterica serovar Kimberley]
MSELKIDNPAQRLLDLLEQGNRYQKTENCRAVWKQILQVEGRAEHHLLTRLGHAMALPGRIIQVREDNFSTLRGKSVHWKTCVDKAFVLQSLNSTWSTFQDNIDDRTLTELGMLSDLFETRGAHAGIAAEEIEVLLERITQLRSEIRESQLSATMKTLLLKQLSQIQEALESYSISGVEPVMDAIQSTLGLAVLHPEYRNEISKGTGSQFGEKISALLTDTASVVTIAGAMPMISGAVQTALTYLSN